MFQVEYVDMLEEQSVAYKKAVDEYRALAEAARAAKALKKASINLVDALPRRQVTNIFTQLRKVRKFIWNTVAFLVLSGSAMSSALVKKRRY